MKTPIKSHGKDQVWWTSTWVQVCLSMFQCGIVPAWVQLSHLKPMDFFLQLSGPQASGICSSSKVASLGRGTCVMRAKSSIVTLHAAFLHSASVPNLCNLIPLPEQALASAGESDLARPSKGLEQCEFWGRFWLQSTRTGPHPWSIISNWMGRRFETTTLVDHCSVWFWPILTHSDWFWPILTDSDPAFAMLFALWPSRFARCHCRTQSELPCPGHDKILKTSSRASKDLGRSKPSARAAIDCQNMPYIYIYFIVMLGYQSNEYQWISTCICHALCIPEDIDMLNVDFRPCN